MVVFAVTAISIVVVLIVDVVVVIVDVVVVLYYQLPMSQPD